MENTYSICPFLKKNHARDEKSLVFIRVTVNGQRAEISLKRKFEPSKWNQLFQVSKRQTEEQKEIKALIEMALLKANKIYDKLLENDEWITADRIKKLFIGVGKKRWMLMEVFDIHNVMVFDRIGIDYSLSTYTRYKTTHDHIKHFMKLFYKIDDVPLQQIKYSFLTDFEHYLKVERRCNHNSTQKYIRNFRKIINTAVKNDWLDKDPFKAYRVKLKETKRVFLTRDELRLLESKVFSVERLSNVRDVFVFCCYTGLSYVDVEKLTLANISKNNDGETWINIDRTKTGNASNVPLLPKAVAILYKYEYYSAMNAVGKILPVISNQRINGYLKEIASLSGIEKNLTFHAARHTFATTVTLSNGIPIETVSAMLGHKNFKTTQIYAKVVQEKISADMKKLKATLL